MFNLTATPIVHVVRMHGDFNNEFVDVMSRLTNTHWCNFPDRGDPDNLSSDVAYIKHNDALTLLVTGWGAQGKH